jgi:hypothetical protein
MAKMGYEKTRLVRDFNNRPTTITIRGRICKFRSKFEFSWAMYLELLVASGEIKEWEYEETVFIFDGVETAPVQYTPDFKIIENNGMHYWQECKGFHDGKTNKKLQRMAQHFPEEIIELVLMRIPKRGKGANRRRVAEKYCRRVIDASVIFKQIG